MLESVTKDSIQRVPRPFHLLIFAINILIPGLGTVLSSFINVHTVTLPNDIERANDRQI